MDRSIRRAQPTMGDAKIIHGFIKELAEYEKEPEAVMATPRSLLAQLESKTPPFESLIAESGDGPVGFVLFFQNYSTWRGRPGIYIEDIYVPPSLRGQGIGSALLGEVGRIAEERKCGRMEWSVLDWNTPSIDFYKKIGAISMDGWTTFRLDEEGIGRLAKRPR